MKMKLILVLAFACAITQAQVNDPSLNIIRVDGQKAKAMLFQAEPISPSDSDFVIKNDKLLVKFWEGFKYWDQMFEGAKKSLIVFPNEKNASVSDTVLMVETN